MSDVFIVFIVTFFAIAVSSRFARTYEKEIQAKKFCAWKYETHSEVTKCIEKPDYRGKQKMRDGDKQNEVLADILKKSEI